MKHRRGGLFLLISPKPLNLVFFQDLFYSCSMDSDGRSCYFERIRSRHYSEHTVLFRFRKELRR